MKIIVCMKQVPAGTKVDIDPETGAMKRMSGETRTNPYDLFALETAISLREKLGGTVTVLTMGPPQAETMMRDAYACGADDAVILSDRKFAGADVLATYELCLLLLKVIFDCSVGIREGINLVEVDPVRRDNALGQVRLVSFLCCFLLVVQRMLLYKLEV